jgi:hypothetical protein
LITLRQAQGDIYQKRQFFHSIILSEPPDVIHATVRVFTHWDYRLHLLF